jgi:molecular chaperone DnaJ
MVETPVNLTKKQKELLREFDQTLQEDSDGRQHGPRKSSWFEGVKNFFEDMKF